MDEKFMGWGKQGDGCKENFNQLVVRISWVYGLTWSLVELKGFIRAFMIDYQKKMMVHGSRDKSVCVTDSVKRTRNFRIGIIKPFDTFHRLFLDFYALELFFAPIFRVFSLKLKNRVKVFPRDQGYVLKKSILS